MSIDESQVTAAVGAVTDPELRRPLAELGMVGSLQTRRKRVAVLFCTVLAVQRSVSCLLYTSRCV